MLQLRFGLTCGTGAMYVLAFCLMTNIYYVHIILEHKCLNCALQLQWKYNMQYISNGLSGYFLYVIDDGIKLDKKKHTDLI